MTQDTSSEPISLGEPIREEWTGGMCIEVYEEAVRIVQPIDGELVPESILIPNSELDDVIGELTAASNRLNRDRGDL